MSVAEEDLEETPKTKFLRMREGKPFCKNCGWREERHIAGWCVIDPDSDEDDDWD
jgi:hypothetical protein